MPEVEAGEPPHSFGPVHGVGTGTAVDMGVDETGHEVGRGGLPSADLHGLDELIECDPSRPQPGPGENASLKDRHAEDQSSAPGGHVSLGGQFLDL